jgi:hypothetical protein
VSFYGRTVKYEMISKSNSLMVSSMQLFIFVLHKLLSFSKSEKEWYLQCDNTLIIWKIVLFMDLLLSQTIALFRIVCSEISDCLLIVYVLFILLTDSYTLTFKSTNHVVFYLLLLRSWVVVVLLIVSKAQWITKNEVKQYFGRTTAKLAIQ